MCATDLFDVVDRSDNVLRQESRAVAHREKLLHRAVHALVLIKRQPYLQRRSMAKDTAPGKWVSSCSGHVDSGEDYEKAAGRELVEEIGLYDPIDLKRLFKKVPASRQVTNLSGFIPANRRGHSYWIQWK